MEGVCKGGTGHSCLVGIWSCGPAWWTMNTRHHAGQCDDFFSPVTKFQCRTAREMITLVGWKELIFRPRLKIGLKSVGVHRQSAPLIFCHFNISLLICGRFTPKPLWSATTFLGRTADTENKKYSGKMNDKVRVHGKKVHFTLQISPKWRWKLGRVSRIVDYLIVEH